MRLICLCFLFGFFLSGPVLAQTVEKKLQRKVDGTVGVRQETQRREDAWAREKAALESRYNLARAHVTALEAQQEILQRKDRALEERVNELQRRIDESNRLEAGLQQAMEATVARLETFIEADLPFLPAERAARIASLKETLALPDVEPADKLRRLLEALQVECEYGDTVETYRQDIEVDGDPVSADVFRLGRLSIFWQTPDGRRVGEYDRVGDRWVEFPSGYRRNISAAVEMAAKRKPVELLKLPVGRIEP